VNIQELIKNADPDRVEEYLRLARTHPYDPDKAEMTEMIVEQGMSTFLAAKEQAEYTTEGRSLNTLHYHARMIVEDLYQFLGAPIQDLVLELQIKGEVTCPRDRVYELRKACEDMGYLVREDIVFRRDYDVESKQRKRSLI